MPTAAYVCVPTKIATSKEQVRFERALCPVDDNEAWIEAVAKRNNAHPAQTREPNRLLAALPPDELSALEPHLQLVKLPFRKQLQTPNQRIEHVYFPRVGVISAVKEFKNGDIIEVATIGNEGMAGHSVALDVLTAGNTLVVQVEGEAVRVTTSALVKMLERCPTLKRVLLRYAQALFQQVAQTAACNRAHTVDERLARWLLMTHDRAGDKSFTLTQEFIAQMLGVHRPTVSIAAGMLQKAGLITYLRGDITIVDRKGLEEASCECYQLIRKQYQLALALRQ